MLGKYASAARGRNIASSGGVNTDSLRQGNDRAQAPVARSTKPKGSPAGYRGGRSTYIENRGAGYDSMPKKATPMSNGVPVNSMKSPEMPQVRKQVIRPRSKLGRRL